MDIAHLRAILKALTACNADKFDIVNYGVKTEDSAVDVDGAFCMQPAMGALIVDEVITDNAGNTLISFKDSEKGNGLYVSSVKRGKTTESIIFRVFQSKDFSIYG